MAVTVAAATNQPERWAAKWYYEYVRDMQLSELIGNSENDPIQMKTELEKESGAIITISLVNRLTNAGITGDNTLEGNEEAMNNYAHSITIDQVRNAVARGNHEQQKTHIDILEAGRVVLKLWAMALDRDDILAAMMSPSVDGSTAYGSCAEVAVKDVWLAANSDRVLFGAAKANNAANDHSAALAQVDSATDVLNRAAVRLMKRMAKQASPHIRPIATGNGEKFVLLAQTYAFRDLKTDCATEFASAQPRGNENPLYKDGDLLIDNVVVKEVEEIPVITGVGNTGIDVAPCFFLGAQAVGYAVGQRAKPIKNVSDYGNLQGAGVAMTRGIDKLMFNSIQHGMLTGYFAGVADT